MDLSQVLASLSVEELKSIKKQFKNSPKMAQIIQLVLNFPGSPDSLYCQKLGYSSSKESFYTLKSRFLDKLIQFLVQKDKNPISLIRGKVYLLKLLTYSPHEELLYDDVNRTFVLARKYECYHSIIELIKIKRIILKRRFNSHKELIKLKELQGKYEDINNSLDSIEELFFSYIFSENINPFAKNLTKKSFGLVQQMESFNAFKSESKTIYFLYQSLSIDYRLNSEISTNTHLGDDISELETLYQNSFLNFKYPFAEIGLKVMWHKYYSANNSVEKANSIFLELVAGITSTSEKRMYMGSVIYIIYMSYLETFIHGRMTLNDQENLILRVKQSDNFLIVLTVYFLDAAVAYNSRNFKEASRLLSKSSQNLNTFTRRNLSLSTEIAMLNLLIYLETACEEEKFFVHELNVLNYHFRKSNFSKIKEITDFTELIKYVIKNNFKFDSEVKEKMNFLIQELQKKGYLMLIRTLTSN